MSGQLGDRRKWALSPNRNNREGTVPTFSQQQPERGGRHHGETNDKNLRLILFETCPGRTSSPEPSQDRQDGSCGSGDTHPVIGDNVDQIT
jgi:hypothetical protein